MEEISAAELPDPLPPRLSCDFNTRGWSGEPDDDCYYVLDREVLDALPARVGLEVFIWDESDETEILGCVAKLEQFDGRWRARPVSGIYVGVPLW